MQKAGYFGARLYFISMKKLFKKLFECRHDWDRDKDEIVKCNRKCTKCGVWQHSMYDMSWGETFWADGKYW